MGNLTSTLTLRLLDQISGPAKKVQGSLSTLDHAARRVTGRHGAGGMFPAVGNRMLGLASAVAGYGAVRGVSTAVKEYASADRALTRIGVTAGRSSAQMDKVGRNLRSLAQQVALPVEDLNGGLDVLVQSGLSLEESMAFLPAVATGAQATGSATDDMAKSSAALATSLKVNAAEMGGAFDAMSVSAKEGQFEVRDMAQHLPKVAASARRLGFSGLEDARRLFAMLQIVRKVSGTAESAATGTRDALEKILSPTVLTAAKKNGLDFLKILEKANKEGRNGAEAIVEALMKATAKMNDVRKSAFISSIFTEGDSRMAIVALMSDWEEYKRILKSVQNSHGSVARDVARVTQDAAAGIQRMSNEWNSFLVSSGKLAYEAGAGGFLDDLNISLRAAIELLGQMNDQAEGLFGTSPGDFWRKNVREPARAKVERMEAERADPFRKRERQAQEELDALEAEIAGKRKTLAGNPVGRLFVEEQLKTLLQQRDQAAQRRDLYKGFTAPGVETVTNGDLLPAAGYPMGGMGSVEEVARFDAVKAAAGDAGTAAMQAFNSSLASQMSVTLSMVDHFVAQVQGKLSFNASPTITPHFAAPSGADPAAPTKPQKKRAALTGSDARRIVRFEGDRMYRSTGLA